MPHTSHWPLCPSYVVSGPFLGVPLVHCPHLAHYPMGGRGDGQWGQGVWGTPPHMGNGAPERTRTGVPWAMGPWVQDKLSKRCQVDQDRGTNNPPPSPSWADTTRHRQDTLRALRLLRCGITHEDFLAIGYAYRGMGSRCQYFQMNQRTVMLAFNSCLVRIAEFYNKPLFHNVFKNIELFSLGV